MGGHIDAAWVGGRILVNRRRSARDRRYVVFTHDLDFGTLLPLTHAQGPSVIQVRTQNVMPAYLERLVMRALTTYASQLSEGVLLTVDEGKARVRILPITPPASN